MIIVNCLLGFFIGISYSVEEFIFLFMQNLFIWVFTFQFLQLHLDPASGNALPASGDVFITQKLRVTNTQHGKVFEVCYSLSSVDVLISCDCCGY